MKLEISVFVCAHIILAHDVHDCVSVKLNLQNEPHEKFLLRAWYQYTCYIAVSS